MDYKCYTCTHKRTYLQQVSLASAVKLDLTLNNYEVSLVSLIRVVDDNITIYLSSQIKTSNRYVNVMGNCPLLVNPLSF